MKNILSKITVAVVALVAPAAVFAQEAVAAVATGAAAYQNLGAALGAGLAIGIAAAGCGLGQGKAVSSALEGIARNPGSSDKIFTPMIIGLALIESLAIYGLLIAFMLLGKIA